MYSNDVYAVDGQQHNLADFFTAWNLKGNHSLIVQAILRGAVA